MTSELVIDVQPKEISIALMEDKALVEFQKESQTVSFSVGNMYLGKVKKIMPGLNACFVDVGFGKDAFLHYLDLGPQFHSYQKYLKQVVSDRKKLYPMAKASMLPDIDKEGTIANILQQGQEVIVQIVICFAHTQTAEVGNNVTPTKHSAELLSEQFGFVCTFRSENLFQNITLCIISALSMEL